MNKILAAILIITIAVSSTSLVFAANTVYNSDNVNPEINNIQTNNVASAASNRKDVAVYDGFTHHSASVNGIVLHYVIGGKGDPVVLLHGWPQTWYSWRHVMPLLAQNYTVIVPDLRGFGDSSKPLTGYGGKIAAEDIYQLVKHLGYDKVHLVGHDIGAQAAYSYAAAHPDDVRKLVIMDYIFPGFYPKGFEGGLWWFSFHSVPDLPETLIEGKEQTYLSWFYKGLAYNPTAIGEDDIDEYASHYSSPGGMRAGFGYYKAFPMDAVDNQEYAKTKLKMPVLVISGDFYPMFGGTLPGNPTLESTQMLAENVQSTRIPKAGHWLAEERPVQVASELTAFFFSDEEHKP